MRFSCTQENLHRGLMLVSQVAPKSVNLPILNNTLINLDERNITLSSTNLETAVRSSIRGKVETSGSCTFPSKLLLDYVSLLPKERVDCQLKECSAIMQITCGSQETKIKGLEATDFPPLPTVKSKATYRVNFLQFKGAIDQVIFAAASTQARPEISGIFMNFLMPGKELVMAATDSFRLAESARAVVEMVSGDASANVSVIVPAKTFHELGRIISILKEDSEIGEANIDIVLGDSQILFLLPSCELISRIIEGKYPEYTYIIPEKFQTEATVSREEFIKAVKTASLFSRNGLYDVAIKFLPGESRLLVSSADEQRGENSGVVSAEISGAENGLVLNYRYLLDGLQATKSAKVNFKMNDNAMPGLLTPADTAERYRYIIMPIRQ